MGEEMERVFDELYPEYGGNVKRTCAEEEAGKESHTTCRNPYNDYHEMPSAPWNLLALLHDFRLATP